MKEASDEASPHPRLAIMLLLVLAAACGSDPSAPLPACDQASPLPLGQTLVRTLDSEGPLLDNAPVQYFSIRLDAPGVLTVDMVSETLDPFLLLWNADSDTPLAQAFDSTGMDVVRTATLEVGAGPGCYLLAASTWQGGADGEYTVRADHSPGR